MARLHSKGVLPMENVIIDTDFLSHILKTPNGEAVMQKIADFYGYNFVMHPWVYEREIKNIHTDVDSFVQRKVTVLEYEDFIKSEEDDIIYEFIFKVLHEEMNRGRPVDPGYQSYRTYNRSGMNLGEIHSVIMSRFTGIPLLLSDDHNAKEIAARRINADGYLLDVKKSFDIMCDIVKTDKSILPKEDTFAVIRNYKPEYQKARLKEIKELYTSDPTPVNGMGKGVKL